MQKRTKRILGLFLLLFVVLTTATAFAYWAGTVIAPSDEQEEGEIKVGVGEDVNTVIEVIPTLDDGVLVPADRATAGQVEVLTYTFEVTWTDDDDASHGALGALGVTATASHALLNVTVSGYGPITAGVPVTVTVTVTLTEPANVTEYNNVAGNNFTLTIDFSIELTPAP